MEYPTGDTMQRAAIAALPWSAALAGALFVGGFVPCCGLVLFPAGIGGIAYLITPRLGVYPDYAAKNRAAFAVGLPLGLLGTAALLVATLLSTALSFAFVGALGLASARGGQTGSLTGLGATFGVTAIWATLYLAAEIVFGAIIGVLAGFFGSLAAFDQYRLVRRDE